MKKTLLTRLLAVALTGVALAAADNVETARIRAKQAAAKVKPVIPE
jgi:formate-dependent phosphoribosylglycinamide formyltransferase (GAR transformylase)